MPERKPSKKTGTLESANSTPDELESVNFTPDEMGEVKAMVKTFGLDSSARVARTAEPVGRGSSGPQSSCAANSPGGIGVGGGGKGSGGAGIPDGSSGVRIPVAA